MKIVLAPRARADLRAIHDFIAADNRPAAQRTLSRIRRTVESLQTFPELGRPWEGGPTRALSIAGVPYRIHYRVREEVLQILRVFHTARMPPEFDTD